MFIWTQLSENVLLDVQHFHSTVGSYVPFSAQSVTKRLSEMTGARWGLTFLDVCFEL